MDRNRKAILLTCAFLSLLRIVASFFPEQRLWGLNLRHYFPSLLRWILVGMVLLVLVPQINAELSDALASLFNSISRRLDTSHKHLKYAALSILSFPFFWLFKEKIYLLGDGNLRASEIVAGVGPHFTESLDSVLHSLVFRISGLDAYTVYALMSCTAGVAFVYLALILSDRIGERGEEKVLAFSVLALLGSNQLFFGYVESYTLAYVATLAFVFFSWLHLDGKCGFWLPVLAFLFTTSLHLVGLTLVPALIYLASASSGQGGVNHSTASKAQRYGLLVSALIVLGAGLWIVGRNAPSSAGLDSILLFPLGRLKDSLYPVYSLSHLLDFFNHQLLVSPVGPAIWLAVILSCGVAIHLKSGMAKFLILVSIPQLLFALLLNPQLGYPRDWDLFAFTASGYTVLGIYLFVRVPAQHRAGGVTFATLALVATALLSTVPWIHVNATQDKAIARFEHILSLNPQRAALGHECLAYNYRRLGEKAKEVEEWIRAAELSGKPRYVKNLGAVYVEMGEYGKAAEKLEEVVKLDPGDHVTHSDLGKVYVLLGEKRKAKASFETALRLRPDEPEYYQNLGLFLLNSGQAAEAIPVFEKALQLRPNLTPVHRSLGLAYANSGRHSEAVRHLRLYLDYAPDAKDRIQIEMMINKLGKMGKER
jgi:tetratricopeptide (TPR) repeat protein